MLIPTRRDLANLPEASRHICTQIGVRWIGGQSRGFNTPLIDKRRMSSLTTSFWLRSVCSQYFDKCCFSRSDSRILI
ncbi:hypothetical protein [Scytonema sp. PRP1]|uniref:hypothetical protein n=1 Tax=Scytonema sp. PRP1 TaxID=3120513 RepID=UPI002FD5E87F